MTTDILVKLFSSGTLVKLMRLFLFDPDTPYDIDDITKRTKSRKSDAQYELKLLEDVGFLKQRTFYKEPKPTKKKSKQKKKKVRGWILDQSFIYLPQLRSLLINEHLLNKKDTKKRFKNVGKVRLVLLSGVFVQEPDARLDLLVVGDRVKPSTLSDAVANLESFVGAELRYTLLSSDDFRYRLSVRDRLLRDVFDKPYIKLINTFKNITLPRDASL